MLPRMDANKHPYNPFGQTAQYTGGCSSLLAWGCEEGGSCAVSDDASCSSKPSSASKQSTPLPQEGNTSAQNQKSTPLNFHVGRIETFMCGASAWAGAKSEMHNKALIKLDAS